MINWLFYACHNLESIDITNFDISKVTKVANLFNGCYKLTSINVSHFNTS